MKAPQILLGYLTDPQVFVTLRTVLNYQIPLYFERFARLEGTLHL